MPMTVRSTPSSFIQAWSTEMVSRRGKPQEKPIIMATSIRGLKMDLSIFRRFTALTVFDGPGT